MVEDMHSSGKKGSILPWVLVGLLLVVVIGGGLYMYANMNQPASANPTAFSRGQRGAFTQNPALRAAMQLMRLERDPQQKLTADQITKVKPILQKLIDTSNPSQSFLQQQADAITAVLTSQQKAALSQRPNGFQGRRQNGGDGGSSPNGGNGGYGGSSPNGGGFGSSSGRGGGSGMFGGNGSQGQSFNPQDIYKQVLASLK